MRSHAIVPTFPTQPSPGQAGVPHLHLYARDLRYTVARRLPSQRKKRILVVDDDARCRREVVEGLAGGDELIVEEAATGEEALASIAPRAPHLLVLDLLLPGIDRFEVLRRLRDDKRLVNLPVLVVTAKDLKQGEKDIIGWKLATLVHKQDENLTQLHRVVLEILQGSSERTVLAASAP